MRLLPSIYVLLAIILLTACQKSKEQSTFRAMISDQLDSLVLVNPDSVLKLIALYEDIGNLVDRNGILRKELLEVKLATFKSLEKTDSIAITVNLLADYYLEKGDTFPLVKLLHQVDFPEISYPLYLGLERPIRSTLKHLKATKKQSIDLVAVQLYLASLNVLKNNFSDAKVLLEDAIIACSELQYSDGYGVVAWLHKPYFAYPVKFKLF